MTFGIGPGQYPGTLMHVTNNTWYLSFPNPDDQVGYLTFAADPSRFCHRVYLNRVRPVCTGVTGWAPGSPTFFPVAGCLAFASGVRRKLFGSREGNHGRLYSDSPLPSAHTLRIS